MDPTKAPIGRSSRKRAAEDRAWMRRVVGGDGEALGRLYDRFGGMLLALAHRVLGDERESEEVVQEVFLQAWRQARRYDPDRSSVSTWLVMITRSRSIDRLRSRKVADRTATSAHQERPRSHTSPEGMTDVFTQERYRRLQEELAKLPDEQRQVLEMAYFDGMTQSEIARRTETPLGTVKTRTLLAMRKLREALADEVEELL